MYNTGKYVVHNKQHNIPSLPADAVFEGRSVDEYATHAYFKSTRTTCADPCDWINFLPIAFNDILP
jgi:hypothetical protein